MSISFPVDEVELATKPLEESSAEDIIKKILCIQLEAYQCHAQNLIPCHQNAFVKTLDYAFNEHRPLIISPDHIWLLFTQGFSLHVRKNAESLRHKFVNHEGQLELMAYHLGLRHGTRNPWEEIIPQFSEQIREHIGAEVHDVLTPKFSTTGAIETFAYEISLMEAMNQYFSYSVTLCGIPSITLEGTVEDWESIQKHIQKFREYELAWWVDALEPILEEFVLASKGQARREFWQSIYKLEGMSGGPYITGWTAKLFPYVEVYDKILVNPSFEKPEKNWLSLNDIPNGLSTVTVKCNDGQMQWNATIKAGFMGIAQNKETMALRPEIAWGVRDELAVKSARKEYRLTLRNVKGVSEAHFVKSDDSFYAVRFNEGVYQILPAKAFKGRLEEIEIQGDIANWREVEYENLLYRYDADTISAEEAEKIAAQHEVDISLAEEYQL